MKEFVEFELIEKLYFFELERKQQLEGNISLPIGAITAAFGVLGYYFTHYKFGGVNYQFAHFVEIAFLFAAAISCVLLSLATYWCFYVVVGSTYEYLPGSESLRKYYERLKTWHADNSPKKVSVENAKVDFEIFLIQSMAKCSQINWATNLVRSEEVHKTKLFTILGLMALAICAFAYYVDFWYDPQIVMR